MPWRLREQGRGRGGGGVQPPVYTGPIKNPLDDPRIRVVLQQAIIREHKLCTGETPWNNNRGNIQRENDTGIRVTPEFPPRANQAQTTIPRAQPAQDTLWGDPVERHKQELLNGVADMRTKLLNSYFFLMYILVLLHFLTYIWFLCNL